MKTYAAFTVEDPRDPRTWSLRMKEVATRDIILLDMPKDTFSFYFFDAPEGSTDIMEDEHNRSPAYIIAEKVVPSKDAHALAMRRKKFHDKYDRDKFFAAVWDVKLKESKWQAVTAKNRFVSVDPDDIVIDASLKEIFCAPRRQPTAEALEKTVQKQTALQRDIKTMKKIELKKNPQPPGGLS